MFVQNNILLSLEEYTVLWLLRSSSIRPNFDHTYTKLRPNSSVEVWSKFRPKLRHLTLATHKNNNKHAQSVVRSIFDFDQTSTKLRPNFDPSSVEVWSKFRPNFDTHVVQNILFSSENKLYISEEYITLFSNPSKKESSCLETQSICLDNIVY